MEATTPRLEGTFVQPSLVDKWETAQWEEHYDLLLEAGIDIMILQWTAMTPNGDFSYVGYDSAYAADHTTPNLRIRPNYVGSALEAAEKKGVKVFLGLNFADEWWSGSFRNDDWIDSQVKANNAMADELYNKYKRRYPNAFYGWYWSWEMYNDTNGDEKWWAKMLNKALSHFTSLDKSLPVLMSPFISGYLNKTPKETGLMWKSFFDLTNFRAGDIFCSQDSVGASGYKIDFIEQHVAEMKKAADTKPYVRFWINIENFSGKSGEGAAPLERVVRQMKMAEKYAEKLITFSYSHYYLSALKPNSYHEQYLKYLKGEEF